MGRCAGEQSPSSRALRAKWSRPTQARVEAARRGNGPVLSGELESAACITAPRAPRIGCGAGIGAPLLTGGGANVAVGGLAGRAACVAGQARVAQACCASNCAVAASAEHLKRRLDGEVQGDCPRVVPRSAGPGALYELEVKTDLGDAMTEISAVRYLAEAEAEFDWILTSAELEALAGRRRRTHCEKPDDMVGTADADRHGGTGGMWLRRSFGRSV